jgi:hypothetical protein
MRCSRSEATPRERDLARPVPDSRRQRLLKLSANPPRPRQQQTPRTPPTEALRTSAMGEYRISDCVRNLDRLASITTGEMPFNGSCGRDRQPHRREVCDCHEFAQKPWERYVLMPTKSALSGARRADVTGFGVPEHHGDGSALPMLVQCGNLSFKIWSSGGCRCLPGGLEGHGPSPARWFPSTGARDGRAGGQPLPPVGLENFVNFYFSCF